MAYSPKIKVSLTDDEMQTIAMCLDYAADEHELNRNVFDGEDEALAAQALAERLRELCE